MFRGLGALMEDYDGRADSMLIVLDGLYFWAQIHKIPNCIGSNKWSISYPVRLAWLGSFRGDQIYCTKGSCQVLTLYSFGKGTDLLCIINSGGRRALFTSSEV